MANETIDIEFEDTEVTMQQRGNKVIFIFGNKDDAQKFFIGYAEGARLGVKVSLTAKQIA